MEILDRRRHIRRQRTAIIAALLAAVLLAAVLVIAGLVARHQAPPVAPHTGASPVPSTVALAPVANVDPSQAPAPGMDPQFAPPDGPAPDYPPFDVDAVSMRDELRTHGVDLPDDRLYQLVAIADKYIAEDKPDLYAYDGRILRDVRGMWPNAPRKVQLLVTNCLAEYVERVIARNHGWAHPPDEDDHHAPGAPH
jgi:hypothetical protein